MQPKSSNSFLKFLKEIAIVVIGVLIAVSINKLKEDYDNKNYVTKTLNTIQKEIDFSKKDVEEVLVRYELLADSLKANMNNEQTLSEIIFGLGGIQAPETKNIGLRF
jgi:uncharacterized protein YoxC